jgi:hypothetical protein
MILVLVFDLTCRWSFQDLNDFIHLLHDRFYLGPVMLLVVNKSDLRDRRRCRTTKRRPSPNAWVAITGKYLLELARDSTISFVIFMKKEGRSPKRDRTKWIGAWNSLSGT